MLTRHKPLKRGTARLKRTRLRPVNRKRKAALRVEQFGEGYVNWLRDRACVACGTWPTEPHHIRSRGAGGRESDQVPLCRGCHDSGHGMGWKTWQARTGVDLRWEADGLWGRWLTFAAERPTMVVRCQV